MNHIIVLALNQYLIRPIREEKEASSPFVTQRAKLLLCPVTSSGPRAHGIQACLTLPEGKTALLQEAVREEPDAPNIEHRLLCDLWFVATPFVLSGLQVPGSVAALSHSPGWLIPYQIELLELGNTEPFCGLYIVSSQLQDLQAGQLVVTQAQHCLDFIF